jgi:cobalamin-dependent methionine synthase I
MTRQVLDPLPITVSRPLVLLRLGYRSASQVPAKTARMLDAVIDEAEGLLRPRAVCARVTVAHTRDGVILGEAADALRSPSRSLRERLDGCASALLFAATIGMEIEDRGREIAEQGDLTRSLLLDAYGSSAAIALGLAMEAKAAELLAPLQPTKRHAPGYADFELEAQAPLLRLVDAGRIGITLTEDSLMLPAKSISGVIGGRG